MYNRKLNLMTVIIAVVLVATFIPRTGDYAVSQSITSGNSIDREQLSALMSWRNIGPARGGRSTAVAGSVTDENLYYFGATGGGVWKTTDGGENWRSIGNEITVGSIGDIDISRSNSNIVFVGTGEACFRGNISHGNGVYKSVDGGNSWQHVGLTESRYIPRLLVHPENDDIIFVAAIGHLYAPPGSYRGDHGVFRSKDGGETWENVLPGVNNQTGAVDISISHRNPNVMFAALYETFRTPYSSSSGGPGSGLYKSADGGDTWTKVEGGGFPGGILGKIGVSISPANNNRVYAMVEAEDGGLYRSDDGGETWTLTNDDRDKRQRAWYYTHVTADPKDEDTVYVLNTGMLKSTDGGKTFSRVSTPHGDNHALWIDVDNPDRMINGNDGGGNVTIDGGLNWTDQEYPTAQFYHVFADDDYPYNVYGAQQDNSTIKTPSVSTLRSINWHSVGGGESGHIAPDPRNSDIVYAGSYGGLITRYDHATGISLNIHPWPDNPMGWGAADLKYRFQWTAPIMVSQHDPTKLYHAANVLFRSTDEGKSWTQISGDLTRNDKSKQGPSGGPLTHDNTSVEYYCTIFALEESPLREGVIWVGSDDGLVHISLDDGKTWTNVTPPQMPEWGLISSIDASNHEVGTAYIAVDRHELDDHNAYAFKTTDYGKTWTAINRGFRDGDFLRVIREDETVPGILYAGTETGVYYSVDDGGSWHSLQLDLPTVPVHDLAVKRNDLIAGTHGRSFWILDDLTIIHQLKDNQSTSGNRLLKPRETIRWAGGNQNRVTFNYFIANESGAEVSFEILDSNGEVVRKYENLDSLRQAQSGRQSLSDTQGWNSFNWNMQYTGARTVDGHPMWAASTAGPTAVPGNYKARLNVGGWNQTVDFTINIDPRMNSNIGQLQQQFDLLIQIRDEVSKAHDTVNQLRMIKTDLEELKKQAASVSSSRSLINKIDDVFGKLSSIEENILQVKSQSGQDPLNFPIKVNNKLAAMTGVASRNYYAPTEQTYEVVEMLSEELNGYVENYNGVIETDIEDLNRMARSENLPPIVIKSPVGN